MTFDLAFAHDIPATTVYARQSWADSWAEQSHLYVDSLSETIGGAFGEASLRYTYGWIQQPDAIEFADVSPLAIDRWYIKIVYTPNTSGASEATWYGVVISTTDQQIGNSAGEQRFRAVTLDWLLTQKQITTTWVRDGDGKKLIYRPVTFNGADGGPSTGRNVSPGNRSPSHGPDTGIPGQLLYIFAEDLGTADIWSAGDVLNYLIEYFPPEDGTGPTWSVHFTVLTYLGWDSPALVVDGRTLYDLINALIDSRRGLAWKIIPSELGCEIRVMSYSPTAIELENDVSVPANTPVDVTIDTELQAVQAVQITDSQQVYSQVRSVGARRGACFTIGIDDGTMVKDWTDNDETLYAAGDPTVAGTTTDEDKTRHDAYRASDKLNHVYTRFRLPDDWDGMAGNGLGAAASYVCPVVQPYNGQLVGGGEPFWLSGLRFSRELPLLRFFDYELSIEDPEDNRPSGALPEYVRSFAVANIGYPDNVRVMSHELHVAAKSETAPGGGMEGASYVFINPNAPGLYIRPTSMPHAQADTEGTDGIYHDSDYETWFSWQTLLCTVFCEWDAHCEAVYPESPADDINDQSAILTIRVGERARMDYVPQGTIVDVREGNIVMAQQDGFVRNDHALLRDIAKLSWEWYSVPRRAVRLTVNHISNELAIGDLIGDLDGTTVNSLVTSVAYDFLDGTTQIVTQFANIDARFIVS